MSSVPTSFNVSFSATDPLRLSQLQQQLQQQALPPNSTVTASYKFTVGSDGSLTPTEARIVTKTSTPDDTQPNPSTLDDGKSGRRASQSSTNLSDIARPHAQLSPSDELAVFSDAEKLATQQQLADEKTQKETVQAFYASDTPPESTGSDTQTLSLAARAQSNAAGLYARNADIVYNVDPVVYAAA